ncbi:MAG: CapA family protein, partial [Candidatus Dormibacteraeota bacterium]|nr:CapA family protein [Candidatus Dormibacteraeota bacterium]
MSTGRRRRPSIGRREVAILAVALLVLAGGVAVMGSFMLGARQVGTPANSTSPSPSAAPAAPTPSSAVSPSPANTSLTLESIFDKQPDLSGIDQTRVVTMIATGDVIPGRRVNGHMVAMNDFLWPFKPTHDYLHTADFVFINLESPLVPGCAVNNGHTTTFCGDPRFIDGLSYAGVAVANLSNNHISNAGAAGTASTEKLLSDHGIQYTGLGFTPTITVKGVKFGFVGFNGVTGGAGVDLVELKREIQLLRPKVDVVIAQFHW